uniref:Proline rich protein n=1 Tax=Magallana gigas TaxID=29159 RepID=C4NYC8_MAGGI|nr:proline rich protein [Crassostrea gigas]ACQ72946.1 proline rich protein [Crassostrea gigas]
MFSRRIYYLLLILSTMLSFHRVEGILENVLARSTNEDREGSIFDTGPIRRPKPRPRQRPEG